MSEVLLDSSILINHLRQKNKATTLLVKLVQQKLELSVSIITLVELYAGKSVWEKDKVKKDVDNLFSGLDVIELNSKIGQLSGKIRAEIGLSIADAIIAATALVHKLPLATHNTKDFERVQNLELFDIE